MKRKLSVSVCLASYNGEQYIKEQILSIINQFQEGDELIVSDDGSKDKTCAIVQEMSLQYPMIQLVPGPKMGFSCNFGNAAKYAKNDIVMYSDQDDVWDPEKLNKICSCFERDPACTTILHPMKTFDENIEVDTNQFPIVYHSGVLRNFIKSCYWGCCIAVRRDFLQKFLPFRDHCVGHDQLTGLMSEKYGKVAFLNEKLICHRVHGDNTSLHRKTPVEMVRFRVSLYGDFQYAQKRFKTNMEGK